MCSQKLCTIPERHICPDIRCYLSLKLGLDSRESACNAGDLGLISGSGRSPGEGNGYPLQYSCLGNLMYRGAWWATVCGVTKDRTQLSDSAYGTCFLKWSTALGKVLSGFFPVKLWGSVGIFQSIYYLPLILALNTVTFDCGQRIRCGFTQWSWIMTNHTGRIAKGCFSLKCSE